MGENGDACVVEHGVPSMQVRTGQNGRQQPPFNHPGLWVSLDSYDGVRTVLHVGEHGAASSKRG